MSEFSLLRRGNEMTMSKMAKMPGTSTVDPVTGYPVPDAKMTKDEGIYWVEVMANEAKRLGREISYRVVLGEGLARALLELNEVSEMDKNRKIRRLWVDRLASEIKRDRWDCTGEPIIISKDGFLNDGQHRAEAVLLAKIPIETMVTFGPERDTRYKVDVGQRRSPGDHLDMLGESNGKIAAAASKLLLLAELEKALSNTGTGTGAAYASTPDATRYYLEHKDEIQGAMSILGKKGVKNPLMPPSFTVAMMVLLRRANPVQAKVFMVERLINGLGLNDRRDPVFLARKKLERGEVRSHDVRLELISRAWNLFRKNQMVNKIQLDGKAPKLIQG